jgi:hypothetical protein
MVWGLDPGEGKIFCAVQTGHEAHTMVTWFSRGVKGPELGADHPPPSNAGLRMDWSYTPASPLRLHDRVMG